MNKKIKIVYKNCGKTVRFFNSMDDAKSYINNVTDLYGKATANKMKIVSITN